MKNSKVGSLFILEGPDNVGKTTLARILVERINKRRKCEYVSFPGRERSTLGRLVYDIHHDKEKYGLTNVDPVSIQTMHLAAHIDCISNRIIPILKTGIHVVLDRYWWSTLIYGADSGCDPRVIEKLLDAEKLVWNNITPDIIFYIKRYFSSEIGEYTNGNLIRLYDQYIAEQGKISNVVPIINANLDETVDMMLDHIFMNTSFQMYSIQDQTSLPQYSRLQSLIAPSSLKKLLGPTVVFNTYWEFASKRQDIFFARLRGDHMPWTDDPILKEYKFTNVYRASDRVSQFLIKEVIYDGSQDEREVLFRIILFKIFNKIETWKLLQKTFGEVTYSAFKYEEYDSVLSKAIDNGIKIYSAAYIMPTGGRGTKFKRKHQMHLHLVEQMIQDGLPQKVSGARSMSEVFNFLRSYHGIGDFLAYQYATDINYSEITNFPETQFVVPGPGARDGIKKCFTKNGGLTDAEIIRVVMDHQEEEFDRLGLNFKTLWGRPLQLIDCQNLFCETDKYARVKHPEFSGKMGRNRIKQKFQPTLTLIEYWFPPKWGINGKIEAGEIP